MPKITPKKRRLLSFKDLKFILGLSRTTIWRLEKKGEFPQHIKIGLRRIAWHQPDVERWIDSRPIL